MAACLASPSHAGTYTWVKKDAAGNITSQSPTYSGGTIVTDSGSGPSLPTTYSGAGPYGGTGETPAPNPAGSATSATCSGQITATFTWQPDPALASDPAPTAVVVRQDSTVRNEMSGSVTSAWDTGLGQTGTGSV